MLSSSPLGSLVPFVPFAIPILCEVCFCLCPFLSCICVSTDVMEWTSRGSPKGHHSSSCTKDVISFFIPPFLLRACTTSSLRETVPRSFCDSVEIRTVVSCTLVQNFKHCTTLYGLQVFQQDLQVF